MRSLNIITLVILIVGGLNWGLVGIADFDLVTALLGNGSAESTSASTISRIVYILVALSALYQIKTIALFGDRRAPAY